MTTPVRAEKIWEILTEPPIIPKLRGEYAAIPPIIQTILAQRGLTDQEEIYRFLSPSLEDLPKPGSMFGMDRAVSLLQEALRDGNAVLIYGDYDADGICATALLANFFQEIGLQAICYLPDRLSEGYGLNRKALHRLRHSPELADQTAPLMITVDCGITSLTEITEARNLGFRIIVTDHHQPGPELPCADAILNPKQEICSFPGRELAGVGVAFYLAAGFRSKLAMTGYWAPGKEPNLKKYLDLVAIGTVADLVSLTGTNRILVKAGLEVINSVTGPGLAALLKKIGLKPGNITSESIAYQLAPRINAAGRVGSAMHALELLCADSFRTANEKAEQLEKNNRKRKEMTDEMLIEATQLAREQISEGAAALVLGRTNWHPGIVGLMASRMVNDFRRPSVIMAIDQDGIARGSVRSVNGIDILDALKNCADLLDRFGGHSQAAGVTLREENIAPFRDRINLALAQYAVDLPMDLKIDSQADVDELMVEPVWNYLKMMEPFGAGNPEPLFCSKPDGIKLENPKKVGVGSLRFQIRSNDNIFGGIAFGMADRLAEAVNQPLQLAFKVCRHEFRGKERWEIRAEDFKFTT